MTADEYEAKVNEAHDRLAAMAPGKLPHTTPLSEWPNGWLIMEVASTLRQKDKDGDPKGQNDGAFYFLMTEAERKQIGWPASREERMAYIREHSEWFKKEGVDG